MATMGWEARQATCAAGVVEGRVAFVRPMAPTPSDHHHHLWLGFPAGRQPWVAILAPLRRLTVRDDLREDCGGPVRHRPHAPEQHTAGDPAPGARAAPRVAFARCVPVAVPLAQRVCGQPRPRRCPPPARPGQGQAPQERFVFSEHHALAPARLVCQSRACERARGASRRGRSQAAGRAVGTSPFFFRHHGHWRARAGRQCGRRTRSRVRGKSLARSPSQAQEGLARPDDCDGCLPHRCVGGDDRGVDDPPGPPCLGSPSDGPTCAGRPRETGARRRRLAGAALARRDARLGHGGRRGLLASAFRTCRR